MNHPEADEFAHVPAERTGESVDAAVMALRDGRRTRDLTRDKRRHGELPAIGRGCSALPGYDLRGAGEILGYDENGAPG